MNDLVVDLNCDVGELPGELGRQSDAQLLQHVSSANIACGEHAGNATIMRQTVVAARDAGVAIGAHPGFADRIAMGRREIAMEPIQIADLIRRQVEALQSIAEVEGTRLAHVKPHGGLYSLAAKQYDVAEAICRGVAAVDATLGIIGQSGGQLLRAAQLMGMTARSEVFADRQYRADGSLVPRNLKNAFVTEPGQAAHRVLRMIRQRTVVAENGDVIEVIAQTICVHGDQPRAAELAQQICSTLHHAKFESRRPRSANSAE